MIIGDVFRWNNFPYPHNGLIKTRWFIFLGDSCNLNGNIGLAFLISPTKKINQHISKYSHRSDYSYMIFNTNDYGFRIDCLIDNMTGFYDTIYNNELSGNRDIRITENIDNSKLKIIYNDVLKNHYQISPKSLSNIKSCFESYCRIVL